MVVEVVELVNGGRGSGGEMGVLEVVTLEITGQCRGGGHWDALWKESLDGNDEKNSRSLRNSQRVDNNTVRNYF